VTAFRLIRYEPRFFEVLQSNATVPADSLLRQRSIVDWYYTTSEYSSLTMVVDGRDQCLACLGSEVVPLQAGECRQKIGCLSGFYAFHPGYGFYGFAAALRGCHAGLMQGGTEPALRFARRLKWHFGEIPAYWLNVRYKATKKQGFRNAAKKVLNRFAPRTPLKSLAASLEGRFREIRITEQDRYAADLLDFQSTFPFRFLPSLSHLTWRYPMNRSFVRYRWYKAFTGKGYLGYVILEDRPDRLIVAQADGTEPALLAAAIIKTFSAAATDQSDARETALLCANPVMQHVFESVGFRRVERRNRRFALGTMKGPMKVSVPQSEWLMNYDLADRGLLGLQENGGMSRENG
jgi:hypothetical protein